MPGWPSILFVQAIRYGAFSEFKGNLKLSGAHSVEMFCAPSPAAQNRQDRTIAVQFQLIFILIDFMNLLIHDC
jgi:hypothetical protein